MRDIFFLNQPSEPATESDRKTGMDLLDTLKAHEEECVGMAANMICAIQPEYVCRCCLKLVWQRI